MEKAIYHDMFLSTKDFGWHKIEHIGESSLFVKEINNAGTFAENRLYCGTRVGQVENEVNGSFEESVYIYVTDVTADYVGYFIVAYEIQYCKDGEKQVYAEKRQGPYPRYGKTINKDNGTITVFMHMFDEPDIDYVDDTGIIISPNVRAALKGWWEQ